MSFHTDAKLRETRLIWLAIGLASGIAISGAYGLALASSIRAGQVELADSVKAMTATIEPMAESFEYAVTTQMQGRKRAGLKDQVLGDKVKKN